jgi:signal transduction histidine kinase
VSVNFENKNNYCCIHITNSGEVPPEIRDRFFDKFVTIGKKKGTGLGTYSARLIVKAFGGTIELDTQTPGFTTVIVCLKLV